MKKIITLFSIFCLLFVGKGNSQWTNITFNPNLDVLQDIHFVDANTGFVCGFSGSIPNYARIFRTTNGGTSWTKVWESFNDPPLFPTHTAHSFFFTSPTRGYCVGAREAVYPFISSTTDGGVTWDTASLPFNIGVTNNIFFSSANVGYIGGDPISGSTVLCKTTDGGNTWSDITANTAALLGRTISDLHFLDDNTGFASTTAGSLAQAGIFKTTNGGTSWTQVHTLPATESVRSLQFINSTTGFAGCTLGKVFKTVDGGNTWTPVPITATQGDVYDVFFFSSQLGYAASRSGFFATIFKTTNGGSTWTSDNSGLATVTTTYYALSFAGGKGYGCGIGGYSKNSNAPIGIDELRSDNTFQLSPNPATSELIVRSSEFGVERIEMWNVVGESLTPTPLQRRGASVSIDVSKLTPGIYFVAVTDDEGRKVVRKFVKM